MIYMLGLLFPTVMALFAFILSNKVQFFKSTPFECGFSPATLTRSSFSLQYAFIALLFILFDIEVVMLLPIPLMTQFDIGTIVIIAILLLGLLYEWKLLMWD